METNLPKFTLDELYPLCRGADNMYNIGYDEELIENFLKKLNEFTNNFLFILVFPQYDIVNDNPWDLLNNQITITDIADTDIEFDYVIHATHLEQFKLMYQKNEKVLTIKGDYNRNFKGLKLIWFSVHAKDPSIHPTSRALNQNHSRYGNIGIKIRFQTLLEKYGNLYSLGTRKFRREREHVIIMSKEKEKTILNLNSIMKYPKIDLNNDPILRKHEASFIWRTRLMNNDDCLHFCIVENQYNLNFDPSDIIIYNHKDQLCIPFKNKKIPSCYYLSKTEAKAKYEEWKEEIMTGIKVYNFHN